MPPENSPDRQNTSSAMAGSVSPADVAARLRVSDAEIHVGDGVSKSDTVSFASKLGQEHSGY